MVHGADKSASPDARGRAVLRTGSVDGEAGPRCRRSGHRHRGSSQGGVSAPKKLAPTTRNYDVVSARNIFVGPPPDPLPIFELEKDTDSVEARLPDGHHDELSRGPRRSCSTAPTNNRTRLRTSAAWSSFSSAPRQAGRQGRGRQDRDRDVHFKTSEGKYFTIHLARVSAMKKELPSDKVKELTAAKTESQ